MKNLKSKILSLFVLFLLSISVNAQDIRTINTKIADILAQMPAKSEDHLNKNLIQTLSLGNEGISGMLQMLKSSGQGDDVAVRFTLTSLARYSSEKGHENEWDMVQENFLKVIESYTDKEIQAYLIHQLNYGANDVVVDRLKKYLKDERLAEPVAQLFINVKTSKAEQTFSEALNESAGKNQVTIVKALGELKSKNSLAAITKLAGSSNIALQRTVLVTLANIADVKSYNLLLNTAQKVSFKYEPTEATASLLKYTSNLGKNGEMKLCKQACVAVIEANSDKALLHNREAAIEIFSLYFPDEAMTMMLKEADLPDSSYRMAVLLDAKNLGDASYTQKWIKKAKASSVDTKADIIYMLGERKDKTALGFIQQSLQDKSSKVRKSAIWAFVKLDASLAEKELLNYMSKGNEVAETESALKTLLDDKKLDQVVNLLPDASNTGKVGIINLIASKSKKSFFNTVYSYTGNQDAAVKASAFSALKDVSSFPNTGELLKLLAQTNDTNFVNQIQSALINTARDIEAEQASAPFLEELKKSSQPEKVIPVLAAIGGKSALKEVAGIFESSSDILKKTSFQALVNWKNADAATYLYRICNSDNEYRNEAFKGYVRQISRSNWPDDQKLLQLHKIMPLARNVDEQKSVINALANVKTFLSLVYVGNYLDNSELQQTAAFAAAQIALPESDEKTGFFGNIPKTIAQKAMNVMSGAESEYIRENLKKYIESMSQEVGFIPMFNGVDLTGWKGFVTDPIKLASLGAKELEKLQKLANEKVPKNWSVRDGMIVFNGEGDNLLSDKEYDDFEMIVNWKISKKGDSGIYLRGSPQVQIWDTTRVEVGAQVGSGGLYNNQKNPSKPLKVADNPIEEWNTFHIKMIGEKVTVYLNGELVVDNVTLENYWERNIPIFPKGTIELQAHGTDLAFKDIYIREIEKPEINLSAEEKAEGFVSLFNGQNLDGWIGNKKDYKAEDGNMVIQPSEGEGGGNLFTEKEYSDFIFRFEFQLTPGANNGLGVRAPLEGDAAYTGMELQILDNTAAIYGDLKPYQYHGSVYGVIAAKREFLKPVGEWNYEEVILKENKIKITLNGTVIVEGDLKEASKKGTLDGKDHPGLLRNKGYIGFLGHGSLVKFRNIRVKEI